MSYDSYQELLQAPEFRDEVERMSQSLYRAVRRSDGSKLDISTCWVSAFDAILTEHGFTVVKKPDNEGPKLRLVT